MTGDDIGKEGFGSRRGAKIGRMAEGKKLGGTRLRLNRRWERPRRRSRTRADQSVLGGIRGKTSWAWPHWE